MSMPDPNAQHHKWYEDVQALAMGALLVSFGVVLYTKATLITGGLAGLSLLLHYAIASDFGIVFFAFNLPFFLLAILRVGWHFTLKTILIIALVSLLPRLIPQWIDIGSVHPLFAAVAGGVMIGMGILSLLRHKSGIGGINILAHYLQEKHNIRAGYFQLAFDLTILLAAAFFVDFSRLIYSIIGALVINLILAINHKRGRYTGFS